MLSAPLFLHASGCCSELLSAGFERAEETLFGQLTTELPHLRVRVPGVRNTATPPERQACASSGGSPPFGLIVVEVAANEPTPLQHGVNESYSLELGAEGGGVLRAATEWGALRGIESLSQLAQWDGSERVLCGLPMAVHDSPEYPWRGLLLDTARHYYPVESAILPLLDFMAAVKLNVLHWHLTDAHSFPVASAALPALAAEGAMHPSRIYEPSALRAVVAAAFARGIRVVPELDMPAHTSSWAFGVPAALVTCPQRVAADGEGLEHGANKAALHPLREETYEAVRVLLAELAAVFPDEYLHLGGDEVDAECWLSDADIRQWASGWARQQRASPRASRIASGWKEALQARFTARVGQMASELGKRVVLWDEALEVAALLPEGGGFTIDVWRDWIHGRDSLAARAGHAVVHSKLAWYLDLPGNTWSSMYEVALPAAPPVATGAAASGAPSGLLGGEASSWSEHADPANLQQRVFTRAAAVAERLWSGAPSSTDTARQRLAALRCRLVQRGLQASPVLPDHCEPPRSPVGGSGGGGSSAGSSAGNSAGADGNLGGDDGGGASGSDRRDGSGGGDGSAAVRQEAQRLLAQALALRAQKTTDVLERADQVGPPEATSAALAASTSLNVLLLCLVAVLLRSRIASRVPSPPNAAAGGAAAARTKTE